MINAPKNSAITPKRRAPISVIVMVLRIFANNAESHSASGSLTRCDPNPLMNCRTERPPRFSLALSSATFASLRRLASRPTTTFCCTSFFLRSMSGFPSAANHRDLHNVSLTQAIKSSDCNKSEHTTQARSPREPAVVRFTDRHVGDCHQGNSEDSRPCGHQEWRCAACQPGPSLHASEHFQKKHTKRGYQCGRRRNHIHEWTVSTEIHCIVLNSIVQMNVGRSREGNNRI